MTYDIHQGSICCNFEYTACLYFLSSEQFTEKLWPVHHAPSGTHPPSHSPPTLPTTRQSTAQFPFSVRLFPCAMQ